MERDSASGICAAMARRRTLSDEERRAEEGKGTMTRSGSSRRRPAVHITLGRAARLHRLVTVLAAGPRAREDLLTVLGIGLRTFYRELELLKRCGVKIRLTKKQYTLQSTAEEAEGRLPFPDPQLSFA